MIKLWIFREPWKDGAIEMMNGEERRKEILAILDKSKSAISGEKLADIFEVSRQVIVQDIALLRAARNEILSTNRGYILQTKRGASRIFKIYHTIEQMVDELNTFVDFGATVEDVFVYHKVYGVIRAELGIRNRKDVQKYLTEIREGKSTPLMNVTSGYHYHTVLAEDEETLDQIQEELQKLGFLAELKTYEPVDFWKNQE